MKTLYIHPTSPSLRRLQAEAAEASGFFDSREHVTVRSFMDACSEAAMHAGMLAGLDGKPLIPVRDLERDLAVVGASARFQQHADPSGLLGALSLTALEEVLARLIAYVDPLADCAEAFLETLKKDANPKNVELAAFYEEYDRSLLELGHASTARVNAAILGVLEKDPADWPDLLKGVGRVEFTGLRWVPPFVEMAARRMADKLGRENVALAHILEEYEQEWWGASLMAQAGSLVFGAEADEWADVNAKETNASIEKLIDLRDGYAMLDPALAAPARPRVGFSHSVGTYGEVEDLARRIAWLLESGECRPDEICFTARNLGEYSDAVTDTFSRFNIPYYFRRGVPVMSIASVKAILNLVTLSVSHSRDAFCSLLDSPWIDWSNVLKSDDSWIIEPAALADSIRRAGVEPEIESADALATRLDTAYRGRKPEIAATASAAFTLAVGLERPALFTAALQDIRGRCVKLGIGEAVKAWIDELDNSAAGILNVRGFKAVMDILEKLEKIAEGAWTDSMSWYDISSIIVRCLKNLTTADPYSTSSGVWVITPYDMAGLKFKHVMAAGLTSGVFPSIPTQNAVFNDADLERLKGSMKQDLPNAALAGSRAKNSQENLLFLTTMAAAGDGFVLSRTSRNEAGQDVPPSVFYSTLWRLAGWPACEDELPDLPPDPYDRWRLASAPDTFGDHWKRQKDAPAHKRQPFMGESFLSAIPLPLCRSADEARQSVMLGQECSVAPGRRIEGEQQAVARTVNRGLTMELARTSFFDKLAAGEQAESESKLPGAVGQIDPELWRKLEPDYADNVMDFSTTALQDLANCPYKYFISRIMGLEELETNELESSPMDFGSAIHSTMETAYLLLLGNIAKADRECPGITERVRAAGFTAMLEPSYIVPAGKTYEYKGPLGDPPADAVPVAWLDPALKEDYLEFFDVVCDAFRDHFMSGESEWKLGAHEQTDIQWEKIRAGVNSIVDAQLSLKDKDYCKMLGSDGISVRRCTAFVEYAFDSRTNPRHEPDADSMEFDDPNAPDRHLKVHGVIDRIDLLFGGSNDPVLKAIMVLDYKGSSKGEKSSQSLATDISNAQDCQLPVYGLAARAKCLGAIDPDLPVICQYLIYKNDLKTNISAMRNKYIRLDGAPVGQDHLDEICAPSGDLLASFQHKLFECLNILESGRFTVCPNSCGFCSYSHVCRYVEPALNAEEGSA